MFMRSFGWRSYVFAVECLLIYVSVAGHALYMLIRAMSLLELRR